MLTDLQLDSAEIAAWMRTWKKYCLHVGSVPSGIHPASTFYAQHPELLHTLTSVAQLSAESGSFFLQYDSLGGLEMYQDRRDFEIGMILNHSKHMTSSLLHNV